MTTEQPIVLDSGAGSTKAGFAGDYEPSVDVPSIVGHLKRPELGTNPDDMYIGNEAQARRAILALRWPICDGRVMNWNDVEQLWIYACSQLQANPEDHPVILSDFVGKSSHLNMLQIMFETLGTPAVYIDSNTALSLYAVGRTTGCVLDCGASKTSVVAVYNGYAVPECTTQCAVGGSMLTSYLMRLLAERGHTFLAQSHREIVQDIKETKTLVSLNYAQDIAAPQTNATTHMLPDGTVINLDNQAIYSPEALFRPQLAGVRSEGLHDLITSSILKCPDYHVRKQLFSNIVLSGGSTMFPNFEQRLTNELETSSRCKGYDILIDGLAQRNISAWFGGSVLGSLFDLRDLWVTKAQYDEEGLSLAYLRCRA